MLPRSSIRAGALALFAGVAALHAQSGRYAAPAPFIHSTDDDRFLDDLSHRAFLYFWEQTDPATGIIRDRARTDGSPPDAEHRDIGSIASTGFGLTSLCIAAEREWQPRAALVDRARTTLRTFSDGVQPARGEHAESVHGWFYHWLNIHTRAREWKSELSSIDTALLLAGVLSVRQCFKDDAEIVRRADAIYDRVDFHWMLNGHPALLAHGWHPETGFIKNRWDEFSEAMILYILGLGSPSAPLPPESWRAWKRPLFTYDGYTYVHSVPPLFIHQYSHAWIDFRQWRDPVPPQTDWFENSVIATHAQKKFLLSLSSEFSGYTENIWGLTASDSQHGYVAWGGPPRDPHIDGTVVPCAPAGSLMFVPEITLPALREMQRRFGDRIYGRYGFADAFHPTSGWVNPDVIGIDVGITLLSAENLRTGHVWRWFMANDPIIRGLQRAGLTRTGVGFSR